MGLMQMSHPFCVTREARPLFFADLKRLALFCGLNQVPFPSASEFLPTGDVFFRPADHITYRIGFSRHLQCAGEPSEHLVAFRF